MNKWLVVFLFFVGSGFTNCPAQTIETQKLEFLIGHIQAFHKGQLVHDDQQFHHVTELPFQFETDKSCAVDSLHFLLGVDSLQHEKGIMDNGLSPANGMYWAWQSGYIFVKWEGFVQNENEKTIQSFTFHLGGFQSPFRCDQRCSVVLKKSKPLKEIQLSFQPTKELYQFVLESDFEIMSPQPVAVQMMKLFSQCLIVQ
ncbi:MAG: hypothetical protein RLY35_1119 [Bacteroidota bacterium]|jgi:hypothetical protein